MFPPLCPGGAPRDKPGAGGGGAEGAKATEATEAEDATDYCGTYGSTYGTEAVQSSSAPLRRWKAAAVMRMLEKKVREFFCVGAFPTPSSSM